MSSDALEKTGQAGGGRGLVEDQADVTRPAWSAAPGAFVRERSRPALPRWAVLLGLSLWLELLAHAADTNAFLTTWLDAQSRLQTWSADFTQTRTLKALKEPIRTPGRLWFAAPNQFRWELGEPVQTIAVRRTNELIVFYPRLKRAEKYPLSGEGREPWRDALALLDAGFPTSRSELETRFRIRSPEHAGGRAEVALAPVNRRARQFLSEVRLVFREPGFALEANEMRFTDGSVLRNDFTNMVSNARLPEHVFELSLADDVKVVEALKR